MLQQGQHVICIDEVPSHSLEGVKGEWHEGRFVLVEEAV